MGKFENATIIEKANVYFGGKVNSRNIKTIDGKSITLGFMVEGEYRFNTNESEIMKVISGSMEVKLAGDKSWTKYYEGESFIVPSKSYFDVRVDEYSDYSCQYI